VANHSNSQNGSNLFDIWYVESQWAKELGQHCGEQILLTLFFGNILDHPTV